MPIRPPNSAEKLYIGPLNIDGVVQVDVNLADIGTITGYSLEVSDSALAIGDGATEVVTPAGAITPASPTLSSNIIVFSLFAATGASLTAGQNYEVIVHYRTANFTSSVTIIVPVVEDR